MYGKELFYVAPDTTLLAVLIGVNPDGHTLNVDAPAPLFPTRHAISPQQKQQYAVAPDGRFLMNVVLDEESAAPITIVQNWTASLKAQGSSLRK